MSRIITIACLLLAAIPTWAQTADPSKTAFGGRIVLTQDYGRATYTRCRFTVVFSQPASRTDWIELSCTPLPYPRVDDVAATRLLDISEVDLVARLAVAAQLYSGGHVGDFSQTGSEGPWERLEATCCGGPGTVVLITDGNPTFTTGSRRDLLNVLAKWRNELFPMLPPRKPK